MQFTEAQVKELCGARLREFFELADTANLNDGTSSAILGVSRSRFTQLKRDPEKSMLQAHIFLNLLAAIKALQQGLEDEWLPASGFKGKAQEQALEQLQKQASQ